MGDVNMKDEKNHTPLAVALKNGNPEIILLLIQNNADQNNSLIKIIKNGNIELMKYILTNTYQTKPEIVNQKNKQWETPLMVALKNNNFTISRMLVRFGADVNLKSVNGQTPIEFALQNGNDELVWQFYQ